METNVFETGKLLKIIAVSFFILSGISLRTMSDQHNYLYICSESTNITAVIRSKDDTYAVISASNIRNILDCLGHSVPYYKREIGVFETISDKNRVELRKRYIERTINLPDDITVHFQKNIVSVTSRNGSIALVLRQLSSPFNLLNTDVHHSDIVFSPDNATENAALLNTVVGKTGAPLRVLQAGEKLKIRL